MLSPQASCGAHVLLLSLIHAELASTDRPSFLGDDGHASFLYNATPDATPDKYAYSHTDDVENHLKEQTGAFKTRVRGPLSEKGDSVEVTADQYAEDIKRLSRGLAVYEEAIAKFRAMESAEQDHKLGVAKAVLKTSIADAHETKTEKTEELPKPVEQHTAEAKSELPTPEKTDEPAKPEKTNEPAQPAATPEDHITEETKKEVTEDIAHLDSELDTDDFDKFSSDAKKLKAHLQEVVNEEHEK